MIFEILIFLVIVWLIYFITRRQEKPKEIIKEKFSDCKKPIVELDTNTLKDYTNKYYVVKEDCIFDSNCRLPENNFSFYKYRRPTEEEMVVKLRCNVSPNKLENCSNYLQERCLKNKTCPCDKDKDYSYDISENSCLVSGEEKLESFSDYFNSPKYVEEYRKCIEGYRWNEETKRCEQFCRNCVTGICKDGICG